MTGRCPLRALLIKGRVRTVLRNRGNGLAALIADFCNKIGTTRTRANSLPCPQLVEADISPKSWILVLRPEADPSAVQEGYSGCKWPVCPLTDRDQFVGGGDKSLAFKVSRLRAANYSARLWLR